MPDASRRVGGEIVVAAAALILVMLVRATSPSDLFHQTQPKTIRYTAHLVDPTTPPGEFALPLGPDGERATKPPLYNWIAYPFVRMLGPASEPAHKMPAVLALAACWLMAVRCGARLARPGAAPRDHGGWLAATMLVTTWPMMKLGWLARPDMVLVAFLVGGWWSATAILHPARGDEPPRGAWIAFWACFVGAALAKGPAALLLPLHAVVLPLAIGGDRRGRGRFRWWIGAPAALALVALWLAAAWRVDPEHVRRVMLGDEITGRVLGTGPEGGGGGPGAILRGLPLMPFYFIVRFAPWTLAVIAAFIAIGRRCRGFAEATPAARATLRSAALFVLLVILFFSLSAGKRADYVAPAYLPAALLGAWLLREVGAPAVARRLPWLVPLAAAIAIATIGLVDRRAGDPAQRGLADAALAFGREAATRTAGEPVELWFTDRSGLLRGVLGRGGPDATLDAVIDRLRSGESFWVIGCRRGSESIDLAEILRRREAGVAVPQLATGRFPRDPDWPEEAILYRAEPYPADSSAGTAGSDKPGRPR